MQTMAEVSVTGAAEDAVVDLLNTVSVVDGELVDALQNDADVLLWLAGTAWSGRGSTAGFSDSSLLHGMRRLRETVRVLIERRKAGERANVTALNAFLTEAQSHLTLLAEKNGVFRLQREWRRSTLGEVIAPVAEAAASFLATADFDLLRRCESEECVLWFYDRTKSHRRRWCSMITCGNRHKVAAFRKRRQQG